MTKNSLRDKLEGDELDLSMMSLAEVPVKEIVSESQPSARLFVMFGRKVSLASCPRRPCLPASTSCRAHLQFFCSSEIQPTALPIAK